MNYPGLIFIRCFLLASFLIAISSHAAIFGDSDNTNGIEDQRLTRGESQEWPKEFRSVGRLYCSGLLQGSAILFEHVSNRSMNKVPMLITTKHVIEDFEVTDCAFTTESDSWRRSPVVSVVSQGALDSADMTDLSTTSKYSADWAILELAPWVGWNKYAIKKHSIEFDADFSMQSSPENKVAHMVGFDVMNSKMVVHSNCRFGMSEQSNLLTSYANLYWDDCDSTQGSSGGGLFVEGEQGYKLISLRVGSLFDEVVVGAEPPMGAEFNIDAYINVSRAISAEMFEPVCTFADGGCELVGNNKVLTGNK